MQLQFADINRYKSSDSVIDRRTIRWTEAPREAFRNGNHNGVARSTPPFVEPIALRSMLKRFAITVMLLGIVLGCVFAISFKTDGYVDAYATETTAISGATSYTLTRRKRFRFFPGPDLVQSPISATQFDNLRSKPHSELWACGPESKHVLDFEYY